MRYCETNYDITTTTINKNPSANIELCLLFQEYCSGQCFNDDWTEIRRYIRLCILLRMIFFLQVFIVLCCPTFCPIRKCCSVKCSHTKWLAYTNTCVCMGARAATHVYRINDVLSFCFVFNFSLNANENVLMSHFMSYVGKTASCLRYFIGESF